MVDDKVAANEVEVKIEPKSTLLDQSGKPLVEYDKDARTLGMACHLSALIGLLGIPFLNIIGPLAVWLWRKDKYAFVDDQGKESLNFQISMTLYSVVAGILTLILIGWVLLGILWIANLALIIIAASKANKGEAYRYPFNLRLIR
jgi:uncharacterized Tic20 family protein